MLTSIRLFAHHCAWNDRLLRLLTDGFEAKDWWQDVAGQQSCWLVGHLTIKRRQMLTMMGLTLPSVIRVWERSFRREDPATAVPRHIVPGELIEAFHGLQRTVASHWGHVTSSDMTAPLDRPMPDGSRTVGTGLRYLGAQETYHLGQLGLMRRAMGKSAVAV